MNLCHFKGITNPINAFHSDIYPGLPSELRARLARLPRDTPQIDLSTWSTYWNIENVHLYSSSSSAVWFCGHMSERASILPLTVGAAVAGGGGGGGGWGVVILMSEVVRSPPRRAVASFLWPADRADGRRYSRMAGSLTIGSLVLFVPDRRQRRPTSVYPIAPSFSNETSNDFPILTQKPYGTTHHVTII